MKDLIKQFVTMVMDSDCISFRNFELDGCMFKCKKKIFFDVGVLTIHFIIT